MCNEFHSRSLKEIPSKGKGFKLFVQREGGLFPIVNAKDFFIENTEGWIEWDPKRDWFRSSRISFTGFCFFVSRRTAERVLKRWNRYCDSLETGKTLSRKAILKEIKYETECHFSFREDRFITGRIIRIALCNKFKII